MVLSMSLTLLCIECSTFYNFHRLLWHKNKYSSSKVIFTWIGRGMMICRNCNDSAPGGCLPYLVLKQNKLKTFPALSVSIQYQSVNSITFLKQMAKFVRCVVKLSLPSRLEISLQYWPMIKHSIQVPVLFYYQWSSKASDQVRNFILCHLVVVFFCHFLNVTRSIRMISRARRYSSVLWNVFIIWCPLCFFLLNYIFTTQCIVFNYRYPRLYCLPMATNIVRFLFNLVSIPKIALHDAIRLRNSEYRIFVSLTH